MKNSKPLGPVNCNNAEMMIAEKLHPPFLNIDRSVFRKTPQDRVDLANFKAKHKGRIKN
jgi:hypothetical protein